jgi:hypothetical protein
LSGARVSDADKEAAYGCSKPNGLGHADHLDPHLGRDGFGLMLAALVFVMVLAYTASRLSPDSCFVRGQ